MSWNCYCPVHVCVWRGVCSCVASVLGSVQNVLSKYVGTHNFHNFTSGKWVLWWNCECICKSDAGDMTCCFLSIKMVLQWKKVSWGQRKAVHHVIHIRTAFPSPGRGIHDPLCRGTEFHASPDQENDWWVCLISWDNLPIGYTCLLAIFPCSFFW